jgi:hypothetical protein
MKQIFIDWQRDDNRTIALGKFEIAKEKFQNYKNRSISLIIDSSGISGNHLAICKY